MISMERSVPVNPPGTASPISRAEVWNGLVLKADNALPFVPQMTFCQVTERINDHQFVRDIEFRGDKMTEKVTLETESSVTFERLAGPVLGTIKNSIDEGANGEISVSASPSGSRSKRHGGRQQRREGLRDQHGEGVPRRGRRDPRPPFAKYTTKKGESCPKPKVVSHRPRGLTQYLRRRRRDRR